MAVKDLFFEKQQTVTTPTLVNKPSYEIAFGPDVQEGQGRVERNEVDRPKGLGEDHPFSFQLMENTYKNFSYAHGAVDKYIDFIIGGGFFVKTEDDNEGGEAALQIINDWMRDVNFDTILRAWIKEALIKGTGFLELGGKKDETVKGVKVLDASWMYIKRNQFGVLEAVNQLKFDKRGQAKVTDEDFTPFEPFEMAILALNTVGDDPYGLGIIQPNILAINKFLQAYGDMHMILNRKANSPTHVKIGSLEHQIFPAEGEVAAFGANMEVMTNKREYVTGPEVSMSVIDYGNIGDKFTGVIDIDKNLVIAGFQVPQVLFGEGNIAEGLANVQMDGFRWRNKSFKGEIEKVVEEQIFRRILNANGLDVHVEFEWGAPSDEEKDKKIMRITETLKLFNIHPDMKFELEKELMELLGLDSSILTPPDEERAQEEEETPQPVVPGQNRNKPGRRRESHNHYITEAEAEKEYTMQEWLGFNYVEMTKEIIKKVEEDPFDNLRAANKKEERMGKFSDKQIKELKEVLKDGFAEGKTIKEISNDILKKVKVKDLLKPKEAFKFKSEAYTVKNETEDDFDDELFVLALIASLRAVMIARTETTRLAALGTVQHYANGGVEKVRFISGLSDRTCPICDALNGQVYTINESVGVIPAHMNCRCAFAPVVEELEG